MRKIGDCFVPFGEALLCFALASLLAMTALTGCQKSEPAKQEGPKVIPVKIARVQLRDIAEQLEYAGNIKAQEEVKVFPKVGGKIIEKLKKDNDPVTKGEPIAYIDRDEVGLKFEKAPVESPLTGTLGETYVDIGANVNSQTAVALVVDMDKVKIILDLPEKYLPKVFLSQPAVIKVDAYPGEEFKGVISNITPVVDTTTRTAPVEILIDNTGHRLNSGMFAKVILVIDERKAVPAVLKEALMGREPEIYVYTIANSKASLKKVVVGARQGPYAQITDGLKEGEAVVVMGQQRLKDGIDVAAEE